MLTVWEAERPVGLSEKQTEEAWAVGGLQEEERGSQVSQGVLGMRE